MGNLLELLSGGLIGGISSAGKTVFGFFEEIAGWFPNLKLDGIKNFFSNLFNGVQSKVAPDLVAARRGAQSAISLSFHMNETSLGVEAAPLKKLTDEFAQAFLENGIPALDAKGNPATAYDAVIKFRNGPLMDLLLGKDSDVGLVDASLPTADRQKRAQEIATAICGIDENATVASLVTLPPTQGLVAMLANIMLTAHSQNFVKGTLDETKISMNIGDVPSNIPTEYVMPALPSLNATDPVVTSPSTLGTMQSNTNTTAKTTPAPQNKTPSLGTF